MLDKLIVLSFDSLQSGDLDKLKRMPYFSKIWDSSAVVRNIREIYPTLTYPIHTTIITGLYPDKHGIAHNQKPSINPKDPDFSIMGSDWYWEKKHVRAKTLADAVTEQGGSVATILWPVTAGEKRGWNLPEIWPQRGSDSACELYAASSSDNVMSEYYDRFVDKYDWRSNEDMVGYAVEIALDILRRHSPDLMLCHVTHLDHIRHVYGVRDRAVDDCLRQLDVITGRFIEAARDAGTLDRTNFVILGDHGQIDVKRAFRLNIPFKDSGFIRANDTGRVENYDAYSFSAGFSAHIMLKNPNDASLRDKVYRLLGKLKQDYPEYIEAIYTSEEAHEKERLTGDFSFVVEACEGILFENGLTGGLAVDADDASRSEVYAAMHGHHPTKGEKPPFLAFGPRVRKGVRIENGNMIDIAPTLVLLGGTNLPQAEGRPLPLLSR